MTKLTILHTVEFYAPHTGGAEALVQRLSEALVGRGHRVVVATSYMHDRDFHELNGVEIAQFRVGGNMSLGYQGPDVARYQRFVEEFPADVMMNYAAQQWSADIALISVIEARKSKVNVIAPCGYSALSDDLSANSPEYEQYFSSILPGLLRLYDAAIYHCNDFRDVRFAKQHKIDNGILIENGVSAKEFRAPPSPYFRKKYGISSKNMILCVANYIPYKGHLELLQAFERAALSDATLVLIGNYGSAFEEVSELAKRMSVKVLANIPRQDTVAAYFEADLFTLASKIEVAPLVLIEAQAAGLPFLSNEIGNAANLKGGLVSQLSEFDVQLKRLFNNKAELLELGRRGRRKWRERFDFDRIVDRYEALYLTMHERKQAKRISQIGL